MTDGLCFTLVVLSVSTAFSLDPPLPSCSVFATEDKVLLILCQKKLYYDCVTKFLYRLWKTLVISVVF